LICDKVLVTALDAPLSAMLTLPQGDPRLTREGARMIIDIIPDRDEGHAAGPLPATLLPDPGSYVTYFCNEHGEEMLFVQNAEGAWLIHSDAEWVPCEVVDGAVDLILNESEQLWLKASWMASAQFRDDVPVAVATDDDADVYEVDATDQT
jgi:hypothetical protein